MKNPFKQVLAVTSDELVDMAFSDASTKADNLDFKVRKTRYGTTRMKGAEEMAQQKEGVRISTCANRFYNKLMSVVSSVPRKRDISEIYVVFAGELVGWDRIENAVSKIKKVANYNKKLQGRYLDKLKNARNTSQMRQTRKEFYGRTVAGAKKVSRELKFLVDAFDILKNLPSLKECPTVILAGLPNVGKTSLLKSLTGSKPEIKAYPFTTKGLMVGYFPHRYSEIQLIDTPGILDRKKRNMIEIHSQIALNKIGSLVVYVFDISETCGYNLDQQMDFYKRLQSEVKKPIIVAINKVDVKGVPAVGEIINKIGGIAVSCESGDGIDDLKKEIIKMIFSKK